MMPCAAHNETVDHFTLLSGVEMLFRTRYMLNNPQKTPRYDENRLQNESLKC
jgi:hypothetical protein